MVSIIERGIIGREAGFVAPTANESMVAGLDIDLFVDLIRNGGPRPEEYAALDNWFSRVMELVDSGYLSKQQLEGLWDLGDEAFSTGTLQGVSARKPRGYAGDFEIIDNIYTNRISTDPALRNWDLYFLSRPGPIAIKERKGLFINLLDGLGERLPAGAIVLNMGSGPARDLYEFFSEKPEAIVYVDCVDIDTDAIAYAQELCNDFKERIRIVRKNVLRFRICKPYDLVWSGGLFDYLDDSQFIFMLKRFGTGVAAGGEIVIGNFSPQDPTRAYMEFGDWHLVRRSAQELHNLAISAGFEPSQISVEEDSQRVINYLRILP